MQQAWVTTWNNGDSIDETVNDDHLLGVDDF